MTKERNADVFLPVGLLERIFGLLSKIGEFRKEFQLDQFFEIFPSVQVILETLETTDQLTPEMFSKSLSKIYEPPDDEFFLGCWLAFQAQVAAVGQDSDKPDDQLPADIQPIKLLRAAQSLSDFIMRCGGDQKAFDVIIKTKDEAGSMAKLADKVGKSTSALWYYYNKLKTAGAATRKKTKPKKSAASKPPANAKTTENELTGKQAIQLLQECSDHRALMVQCEESAVMALAVYNKAIAQAGNVPALSELLGKPVTTVRSAMVRLNKAIQSEGGSGKVKQPKKASKSSGSVVVSSGSIPELSGLIDPNVSGDNEEVLALAVHGRARQFKIFWERSGGTVHGCQERMARAVFMSEDITTAAADISGIIGQEVAKSNFKKWARKLGVTLEFGGGIISGDSPDSSGDKGASPSPELDGNNSVAAGTKKPSGSQQSVIIEEINSSRLSPAEKKGLIQMASENRWQADNLPDLLKKMLGQATEAGNRMAELGIPVAQGQGGMKIMQLKRNLGLLT